MTRINPLDTESPPRRPSVWGMALLRVPLDSSPDRIAELLAVDAAVRVATGFEVCDPVPGALDWQDGEGIWMGLVRPGDGRALLVGWHHDFSLTEGSGRSGEAGTDLIGDAPGWWRRGVEHARSRGSYLGFLYGWDGASWWRLDQPVDDGFDPEIFPVSELAMRDIIERAAAETLLDDPPTGAVDELLAAGGRLGERHLAAVLHSPDGWPEVDLSAGVFAARVRAGAVTAG